jgi:hypothetical protein
MSISVGETYARAARDGDYKTLSQHFSATDVDPEALRQTAGMPRSPGLDVVTPDEAIERMQPWLAGRPIAAILFWASIAGMPSDLADRHVQLDATRIAPALAGSGEAATAPS